MGLFDVFKKKKEVVPEAVNSNGQVQVQPVGVQVVSANPVSQVAPIPVSSSSQDMVASQVSNVTAGPVATEANPVVPTSFIPTETDDVIPTASLTTDVNQIQSSQSEFDAFESGLTNQEFVKSDSALTGSVDVNAVAEAIGSVPGSAVPAEENAINMNQTVDNSNPLSVQQTDINDEKNISQDIVPAVEDVAALIDNPIPAKSEEESMSANPEEMIGGGDEKVDWQKNPFQEDDDNSDDNVNLMDNIVSSDQGVISHNEPMDAQSFEPLQKEDDIQDLSSTLKKEEENEEEKREEHDENTFVAAETKDEEDTVIKVENEPGDKGMALEQANIFKENITSNNTIDDNEFVPIVVDENEEDTISESENSELKAASADNNEFADMIGEVTPIVDENPIPPTIDVAPDNEKRANEVNDANEKDEVTKVQEEDSSSPKEVDKVNNNIDDEFPDIDENVSTEESLDEPILFDQEEANIFSDTPGKEENTIPSEKNTDKAVVLDDNTSDAEEKKQEEVKVNKPAIVRQEDLFEGPVIEEEKPFSIFDLPSTPVIFADEYEKDVFEEEMNTADDEVIEADYASHDDGADDQDIIGSENLLLEDEKEDLEEQKDEQKEFKKVEKVEDISDMYSQLEFKNEKIRFCDNCGAMIVGESATVCPSCGEPL